MATSKVKLMNRSLRLCGASMIMSPDDGSLEAKLSSACYDEVLETVLSDGNWSFATKWEKLAKLDFTPSFGHRYAYRLADDTLKLIDIRAEHNLELPSAKYSLVGQDIYCDIEPCFARYVFYNKNESQFTSPFCEAFTLRLACELAPSLARDSALAINLRKLYTEILSNALLQDSQLNNPIKVNEEQINSFILARS